MKLNDIEQYRSKSELLEFLIKNLGSNIKILIYSYVRDWSAAEDLTQETFLTCYKKMDEFREESSYKTWLYKIAINKSKDYLKSRWYKYIIPVDFISDKYNGEGSSVDELLIIDEDGYTLSRQVLSLPKKYREIIILYYYEELKIREIEELTDINQETIKSRLRRAKEQLRKKWKELN